MFENNKRASFPSAMLLFYQHKEAASTIVCHYHPSILQQQIVQKNSKLWLGKCHTITKSLRLEGISGDHLLQGSKTSQLQLGAQDCVQLHFERLQGQRLHKLSRQPVPLFNHPHSYVWESGRIFHYSVKCTDQPGQTMHTHSLAWVPHQYALGVGKTHWL